MDEKGNVELQDVFKISGIPTHTFVKPSKYNDIIVNLKSPGRALVVEGPSGIGKTTAIKRALEETDSESSSIVLSARKSDDIEYIRLLPTLDKPGTVIIDDFHVLPEKVKRELSGYLKRIADEEQSESKVIIVGINRAGDSLIQFAPDLVNRIDIIHFEAEPDEKIYELLKKGQLALNISLNIEDDIVAAANGSFYIAQLLAHAACVLGDALEKSTEQNDLELSFSHVEADVQARLARRFRDHVVTFCRGPKFRPTGRAPYLHLLYWLSNSGTWSLDIRQALRKNAKLQGSVNQVVQKGFLRNFLDTHEELKSILHFDDSSQILSIEDPQFLFYIKGIPWNTFAQELGFSSVSFDRRYDYALSFSGDDRDIAEALFKELSEHEVEVFYDKNEQARMLAEDLEQYLYPIYNSEATIIIIIHGSTYPKRIWTRFEAQAFRDRMGQGSVIPIWVHPSGPAASDEAGKLGALFFDRSADFNKQIKQISKELLEKLAVLRT